MKISKQQLIERLKTTSVEDLAVEIAGAMAANYPVGAVDMTASIAKFEAMLRPLATVSATDLMAANGIKVVKG